MLIWRKPCSGLIKKAAVKQLSLFIEEEKEGEKDNSVDKLFAVLG
jgi:hypothetical protein